MKPGRSALSNLFQVTLFFVLTGCSYYVDKAGGARARSFEKPQSGISFAMVRDGVIVPRCIKCHGEAAATKLNSFERVKARVSDVERTVLLERSMPQDGPLAAEQERLLADWIAAGAPESVEVGAPEPSPTASPTPGPSPSPDPGSRPQPPSRPVSFQIVNERVFIPRCLICHGPASEHPLDSYSNVKRSLEGIISAVLVERTMPLGSSLSRDEIGLLTTWIAAGAPERVGDREGDGDHGQDPGPGPGPSPRPTPTPIPLEPTYSSIRANILVNRCILCHSPGGSAKQVPLVTFEDLLDSPRELVLPGNADESGLVLAIERDDEKRMPPPMTGPALSEAERLVIRDWISKGAKP